MTGVLAPGARIGMRRLIGGALAVVSVILPALHIGPLFAQPPFPLVGLWAAYGWASEEHNTWRTPAFLFALGLLHDQMAGGPYGVFASIYAFAFFAGLFVNRAMSAPDLTPQWGGFIAVGAATSAFAAIAVMFAFGRDGSAYAFMETTAVTALVFPLARPLYMNTLKGAKRPGAA